MQTDPHLYVDADACPVKPEAVKVAERHGLPVTFVANSWLALPRAPRVRMQVVTGAFDAADDWIVEQVIAADIVINADNIGNALATRELMSDLRAYGVGGGPPPFGPRDRSRFLDALELVVREARRQRAGSAASSVTPPFMAP